MKRFNAVGPFLSGVLFFCSRGAVAEVVIGPGVQPPIDISSNDHYRLLAGTQITSPSLTRPPDSVYLRIYEAVSFRGGGSLRVDGGTYRGGNDSYVGPTDTYDTAAAGNAMMLWDFSADIFDGTFAGGNAYSTSSLMRATAGIALYAVYSTVNIFGGSFYAGSILQPNYPYYPSNYPSVADALIVDSTVHLHGGDLGFIVLNNSSTLHIYGRNLGQLGTNYFYGQFASGRQFSLLVYREGQAVFLHELVPEPNLMTLAFLACSFLPLKRCHRRRTSPTNVGLS